LKKIRGGDDLGGLGGLRVGEGKGGKAKRRRRLWGRGRSGIGLCSFAVFPPKWNVCARRRRGVFFTDDLFLGTVEVTVWKKFEAGGGGGNWGRIKRDR